LGLYPSVGSLRHLISPEQIVTPHPEAADVYQQSYETFQQIYRALRPIHHRMNPIDRSIVSSG
jgi:sugar (pentulose or hexulose) kinase